MTDRHRADTFDIDRIGPSNRMARPTTIPERLLPPPRLQGPPCNPYRSALVQDVCRFRLLKRQIGVLNFASRSVRT